jgi:hypothetical protein
MTDNAGGKVPGKGGCACGTVRYRVNREPMFVHCCHCRWCQRESGASFALNLLVESSEVQLLQGVPECCHTPSESGKGQDIYRCPKCRVAVWSHYAGAGDRLCFVRVGTLDKPYRIEPDIHIYTESKQPWVVIPGGVPAYAQYYDPRKEWPPESQARYLALKDA